MSTRVYSVCETRFVDSGELNGDDPATSNVHVLSTLPEAEYLVVNLENDYCRTIVEELLTEDIVKEYIAKGWITADGDMNEERVGEIFEELNKGEFVPVRYLLEIEEHAIHVDGGDGKRRRKE